jgi:hypothetical protein
MISGNTNMKRKLTILSLSLLALAAFWFLGVDGSWFVENCPDCNYGRSVYQIRVFTIPIYEQDRVFHTPLEKMLADLGISCSHPKLNRMHIRRCWGLLICGWPCINGTFWMGGDDDWYDAKASAIVRELAKKDPALRGEFAGRVLKNHDWKYLKAFVQKISALRDAQPP